MSIKDLCTMKNCYINFKSAIEERILPLPFIYENKKNTLQNSNAI